MRKGGVTVAYSGVHQAYQLALAAEEAGALDCFYCSIFSAPGKWGGLAARFIGAETLASRRVDGLPPDKVRENPFPLAWHRLRSRVQPHKANDWSATNGHFDHWVSRQLPRGASRVFVGVETCAERSLQMGRELGMTTVFDCPQIHPDFLEDILARGADHLKIPKPPIDTAKVTKRKRRELRLADFILVLSDVHRRSFLQNGFGADRLLQSTLWADPNIWFPPPTPRPVDKAALKALFIGGIGLRKGVPYLLQAAAFCRSQIELTLVGSTTGEVDSYLHEYRNHYKYVPPKNKVQLRDILWNSDVLVLPSLVDTFGFVAMEAMACGLPVIVTDNCGVPVPNESWRIPVMSSEAIAQRLVLYARDRILCREHGRVAAEFAQQFTPERYREKIKGFYRRLLDQPCA
jgi:glycosyltransferase involved in cell wall biosynthesis